MNIKVAALTVREEPINTVVNLPVPLGLLLGLVIAVMKDENNATVVPTKSDSDIYFVYNY